MRRKAKYKYWQATNLANGKSACLDTRLFVDAREEARRVFGLSTYDGIMIVPAALDYAPFPNTTVYVVEYKGSAMNCTLELFRDEVHVQ